jgi:hypothetical protein
VRTLVSWSAGASETGKQIRQARLQSLRYSLDIQERNISHTAFDSAEVCPMQPATFRSFFLIDPLCLANAADCTAKPDADIERH